MCTEEENGTSTLPPIVLTIAGSDSSGGAGIQADLKAIAANGGYGASVVTAVTAQNTRGVTAAETVSQAMLRAQLDAVFSDLAVAAVKTGMLGSEAVIAQVAEDLAGRRPRHLVCDPVMISKSGFALLPDSGAQALIKRLVPLATLVTPNTHEAARLAGMPVETLADAERAGRRIVERGAAAALVKGGHLREAPGTDVLVTRDGARRFAATWIPNAHTHGTGCAYSAAIATQLARGRNLEDAVARAKAFITAAIRAGFPVGAGIGPTDPFYFLRGRDLPPADAP